MEKSDKPIDSEWLLKAGTELFAIKKKEQAVTDLAYAIRHKKELYLQVFPSSSCFTPEAIITITDTNTIWVILDAMREEIKTLKEKMAKEHNISF